MQILNKQNEEKSDDQLTADDLYLEAGVSPHNQQSVAPATNLVDYLREDSQEAVTEKYEVLDDISKEEPGEAVPEIESGTANMGNEAKEDEKLEVSEENLEKEASVVKEAADDKKEPTSTRYSLYLNLVGTGIIQSIW